MTNAEVRKAAVESLSGKWPLAIGTFFLYVVIQVAVQIVPLAGWLAALVISGPLMLGISIFALAIARGKDARLEQIFEGFNNFSNSLALYLLMLLFILLWALLLIIPGIIMAIAYGMAFYIMVDEPGIKPMDALEKSKKMMYGHKARYFWLCMWFLLLALGCIITLGIGFLWLIPYVQVCTAKFYEGIKPAAAASMPAAEI